MTERDLEKRRANYATHKPRWSDSSLYDEVCTVCGAKDFSIGPDELSDAPCPNSEVGIRIEGGKELEGG